MDTFTLKSGTNKGNRRIWIEGQRLLDAGLVKGTALHRLMNGNGTMTLSTRPMDGARRHTVSGKGTDHPILDLSGKWVTAFIGDHTHFTVEVRTDAMDGAHQVLALIITPTTI
tara:strand:- start:216 stop:554 length:339 start_codon:yes stop_codon:yes gene_type:complete